MNTHTNLPYNRLKPGHVVSVRSVKTDSNGYPYFARCWGFVFFTSQGKHQVLLWQGGRWGAAYRVDRDEVPCDGVAPKEPLPELPTVAEALRKA